MYVCVCKAVSEKKVQQLVAEGACSMRELKQCLGVGSQCGKCVSHAQAVLDKALSTQPACFDSSASHLSIPVQTLV